MYIMSEQYLKDHNPCLLQYETLIVPFFFKVLNKTDIWRQFLLSKLNLQSFDFTRLTVALLSKQLLNFEL